MSSSSGGSSSGRKPILTKQKHRQEDLQAKGVTSLPSTNVAAKNTSTTTPTSQKRDDQEEEGEAEEKKTSSSLERRHSRASSVDRREIFQKYIQNAGEHAEDLRPYANDDPDLLKQKQDVQTKSNRKRQQGVPAEGTNTASASRKEFRLVRLRIAGESDLGVFVARSQLMQPEAAVAAATNGGCAGYFVACILPNGVVSRYVEIAIFWPVVRGDEPSYPLEIPHGKVSFRS